MADDLREEREAVGWTGLRARCAPRINRLLHHVGLPNPWDIDEFCDRLERHRGRAIDLVPVTWTPGDSTGLWKRRDERDVIGYAANTSSLHQEHIILHEIGHVISEHRGRCALSAQEARRRAPHLAPAAFAHLLGTPLDVEEREAETIATMILAHLARRSRREPSDARRLDARTSATLGRLTAAFDDPD